MAILENEPQIGVRDRTTVRIAVIAAALGVVVGLGVGAAGYAAVRGDDGRAREHVGDGYVGVDQASLWAVKGQTVAVTTATPWIDSHGTMRTDGWPSCLPFETEVRGIHWADVQVTSPDGDSVHQVVYVDCSRSA